MTPQHKRIQWLESGGWSGIEEHDVIHWSKCYPRVEVDQELRAMDCWLRANPKQRKKNYARMIVNWLARCAAAGGSTGYTPQRATCSGSYEQKRISKAEIEAVVSENTKEGGSVEQLRDFRKGL